MYKKWCGVEPGNELCYCLKGTVTVWCLSSRDTKCLCIWFVSVCDFKFGQCLPGCALEIPKNLPLYINNRLPSSKSSKNDVKIKTLYIICEEMV